MSGRSDAGMRAVARVRAVRERDSRLGLQQALAEQHQVAAEREQRESLLRAAPAWDGGSVADFLAERRAVEYAAAALRACGERLVQAQNVSAAAQRHWAQDHVRLSAVEMLLARRAAERKAALERREAAALDEVAAQMWQRAKEGR